MLAVFLTPRTDALGLPRYAHEVAAEFARQARVHFYGPGYPGYSLTDTIADVVAKARERLGAAPDWIILGHAWLEDADGQPAARFPRIDPAGAGIPAAVLFHREYANLNQKLEYVRHAGLTAGFSHHDNVELLTARTGVPFHFWPFAVDHRRFTPPAGPEGKTIDLGFSGTLQHTAPGHRSDLRVQLMREMFACVGDVPLRRRAEYRDLEIVFSAAPRDSMSMRINSVLKKYRRLDDDEYAALVRACRMFLTTRSPADLVSTRYFECMASRTLVIAEANPAHRVIFPESCLLEFRSVADFRRVLREARTEIDVRAMIERAYAEVIKKHTWEARVAAALRKLGGTRQLERDTYWEAA